MTEIFTTLFFAWAALSAAAISPGPNLVAVASRGLGSGRKSALTVAFAFGVGAFLWALITAGGLGTLFEAFPVLLRILGVIGGTYLAWLGFKGWRAALTGRSGDIQPKNGKGAKDDFLYGFMITATNPKVMLMWMSISTFVSEATTTLPLLVLFASVSAILIFLIYGTYGIIFSTGHAKRLYDKFRQISEAVFGTIFGIIGLGMIFRALFAG